ncbi:MAG: ABC transporter permease [Gammaproteobacteria bacterium]|nr:ABC transporter permease [Gammaproteobacteria bacterium]
MKVGLSPRLRAAGLTVPLIAFIAVTFIAPLGTLLTRSVYDAEVAEILPRTMAVLADWDTSGTPSEAAYATIAMELLRARDERTLGRAATRINRIESGLRSVVVKTPRRLGRDVGTEPPGAETWRDALVAIDEAWGENATWRAIREAGQPFTSRHFLNAVDLETRADGSIAAMPESRRIYVPLYLRTLWVSLGVTALCLVIGYPIAHAIAHAGSRWSTTLLVLVLVPFWTSLLVRTTAWIVLLQNQGVVNDILVALGIVADDGRLAMIYNMTGTFVAMTHVLLPFMVLPLYSVMRSIPTRHMDAAASLGATPMQAFRRVYWPQTLPGVGAGSLLVFILAIGYYITPALVGGQSGQLISNMIAYHMQTSLNWGLAAALAAILLLAVIGLYVLYDRVVGIDRMRLG